MTDNSDCLLLACKLKWSVRVFRINMECSMKMRWFQRGRGGERERKVIRVYVECDYPCLAQIFLRVICDVWVCYVLALPFYRRGVNKGWIYLCKMADLEAVLADVSYLMAMEKSKCTPAARASKKIILPDPRWEREAFSLLPFSRVPSQDPAGSSSTCLPD